VVIDEIHALHASKRGDLLALGLARLSALAPGMRRIGLSATVDDPDVIRRWMGCGDRPVDLVRGPPGAPPEVDLLLSNGRTPWAGHTAQHAMAEVYDAIRKARTALVFVNTRFQAEFAFQELWKLNDDGLPIALHHGSLAPEQRRKVEAAMARGELKAVVCTSTLDLGIDWGDVDLVIQLASPKGASRMVQRIGRANHRLDEPSRALFVPANRFETLECQAARECIAENRLDGEPLRTGALDVLAQHLLGCACAEPFGEAALLAEVRTAGPFQDLSPADFDLTLDLTATGGYALQAYDRFRRLVRNPEGLWTVRNGETARRHRLNLGAILSPEMLSVRIAQGARLLVGNERQGALYAPTVIDRVRPELTVVREETFGPVSPILTFANIDEAIALANSTAYGLSSGVCTNRMDDIVRFINELHMGTVNIREVPGYRLELTPFGGIKDSGLGYKEGVQEAIKSFTNLKTYSLPWSA
jgi:ATP-dependent Lhr-like helicase